VADRSCWLPLVSVDDGLLPALDALTCAGYNARDVSGYLSAVRAALDHPNLATDLHLPGSHQYRGVLGAAAQEAAGVGSLTAASQIGDVNDPSLLTTSQSSTLKVASPDTQLAQAAAPALDMVMMRLNVALRTLYPPTGLTSLRCLYNMFIGYLTVVGDDGCDKDDLKRPPPPLTQPPPATITSTTSTQGLSRTAVGGIAAGCVLIGIMCLGLILYMGLRPDQDAHGRGGRAAGVKHGTTWAAQLQSCMTGVAQVCQRYAHTVHPRVNEAWQQARGSGAGATWLERGRYSSALLSLVVTDIGKLQSYIALASG
jgi:hypothetical protein